MVRTRAQSNFSSNFNDDFRATASRLFGDRLINPSRSPSKASKQKQKLKSKRDSEKIEKILSLAKQNLSKVADRVIPDRPAQPKTLFDQIHEPILNGVAKRNLRPVGIVIDD